MHRAHEYQKTTRIKEVQQKDTRETMMKQSNPVLFSLKLLIISTSLFIYRGVHEFRANQEAFLKLFIIIALVFWLIDCLKRENFSKVKTVLDLPLLIFFFIMAVSVSRSPAIFMGMKDLLIFCSYFLIYFLTVNNIEREEQIHSFISCLFVLTAIIALYSILQYYSFDPYLGYLSRITSTIGQKNWVSDYVAMLFPLVFFFFLTEEMSSKKISYHFLLALLWTTLMICQSRSIWISVILCSILTLYFLYKFKLFPIFRVNKKWLLSLVMVFALITIIYSTENPLNRAPLTVPERAMSTLDLEEPSIKSRLLIWNVTLNMIKDNPVLGMGLGAFSLNYPEYQADFLLSHPEYINVNGKAEEAHNEYLQMWAELGLIGLILFLFIILLFYKSSLNFIKEINQDKNKNKDRDRNKDRVKFIVLGLIVGITSTLIHGLASFPFHVPALGAVFFLLVGLVMAFENISGKSGEEMDPKEDLKKKDIKLKTGIKVFVMAIIIILMALVVNGAVLKPYLAEIYYFQGLGYGLQDKYEKALPKLEYALKLNPHNGSILHTLGGVYFSLDDCGKAIELSEEALKYRVDKTTSRNLGLFYLSAGLYDKAKSNFIYALYLDPKYSDAYQYLGQLCYLEGDMDKAISIWNKGLEMNPDYSNNYVIYYNLGLAYSEKGLAEKAEKNFNKVLELAPEGSPYRKKVREDIEEL